jgi:hypothetical protein
MIELELHVPSRAHSIPGLVERICLLEGLEISLKGTLAGYPGSVHWHFKKGKPPGTLELTWWEREKRLWFKVAAGRSAGWVDEMAEKLRERIEQALLAAE